MNRQELEGLGFETFPAASAAAVADVEAGIGCRLPDELRMLLNETDGAKEKYGFSVFLSAAELVHTNREFRTIPDFAELYMPFDHLLIFGEEANSNYYMLRILAGKVRDTEVFVWRHEDDSREHFAYDFPRYVKRRLDGGE